MIGGLIILTLFLTALSVMVYISQQFDAYQTTAENMNQMDIQAFSENLAAVYPGIYQSNTVTGGGCTGGCNTYTLLVSNEATIGTQIVRLYINSSVAPGCTNLCVINLDAGPTPQPFTIQSSTVFVNPSEFSHPVTFYLNSTVSLPVAPGSNSVSIVTARGRGFAFQWPFPPTGVAMTFYMATHTMMIAYQSTGTGGYSSSNEGQGLNSYCHQESPTTISTTTYGSLSFVNPWVTQPIFSGQGGSGGAFPWSTTTPNNTRVFVYINLTNTQAAPITVTGGNLVLQTLWQGATISTEDTLMIGGPLVGIYYPAVVPGGTFYSAGSSPAGGIASGESALLIFRVWTWNWYGVVATGSWTGFSGSSLSNAVFTGTASITNGLESGSYFGASVLLDGLYIRPSC
jgi:hypothetical protein